MNKSYFFSESDSKKYEKGPSGIRESEVYRRNNNGELVEIDKYNNNGRMVEIDKVNDEVIIFGNGKNCPQNIFDVAKAGDAFPIEILCHTGYRINRVYINK